MNLKLNAFFGLMGFLLPSVAMFSCYPVIISKLGSDAFGVFILVLSIPGFVRIVDLGFFAATIRFIALDLSNGNFKGVGHVCITSLFFYLLIGIVGSLVTWIISPWLITILNISNELADNALVAFYLAAIQIPAVMLVACITSIFKGLERFHLSTWVLSFQSFLSYGSVAVGGYFFDFSLREMIETTVVVNYIVLFFSCLVGFFLARKLGIVWSLSFSIKEVFKRMFGFGYIMAINSIVTVLVTQLPKFIISWSLGPPAVGIYTIVFSVSSKVQAAVNSAVEVLFPYTSRTTDLIRLKHVLKRIFIASSLVAFLSSLILWTYSYEILNLWVGKEMAENGALLLKLFSVSIFFLAVSASPYHLINGLGIPWKNTQLILFHFACLISSLTLFSFFDVSLLTAFGYAFIFANFLLLIAYLVISNRLLKANSTLGII